MDLGAFLADDSLGSWADGDVDFSSVGVPSSTAAPISTGYTRPEGFAPPEARRDRVDYPVPDAPPYKARVANLPYDATEASLTRFFEDRLQAPEIVHEVKLPMDQMSGRPKGYAFVTFSEKAVLEEALQLTMSEFAGRKIFVNVAAPQKADVFDNDWRSSRTGPMGGRDRFESDVELDWGAARSSGPPRSERERRPRREEPDLDWGSARSTFEQPKGERAERERGERERGERERFGERGERGERGDRAERPKREEVELDWGSARTSAPLRDRPAKEFRDRDIKDAKKDGDLDWSSARGSGMRRRDDRKEEKEFDWKRGQALPPKAPRTTAKPAKAESKDSFKPQKSVYDVLALDDEDDDETGLENNLGALSVAK